MQSELRPLSARSVVLSLLLGAHPPELPVADLIRGVERFGVSEPTVRVALSRMVAAGDLRRTGAMCRLSDRLVDRQRRQDASVHPETRPWRGQWEMAVITATGRGPADRAELRTDLAGLRMAELREGFWLRPANLRRPWPAHVTAVVAQFTGTPEEPAGELAGRLWPLDTWAADARRLLEHFSTSTDPAVRLTAAAAIVRHLLADPVLPAELLQADWPADDLRAAYADYRVELIDIAGTIHTA
ncbi:PaaX family transcriptional regulator C-terminal domain-containing protein [Actinokineospora sp. HUAS TT18]|uniref:PaaX family transcriptional regulator C-terminal domain-containing protein n=1 Tax=Actinokineospora sp. HUAS TT18 TaxID=3447451 RepID=UPI003F520971